MTFTFLVDREFRGLSFPHNSFTNPRRMEGLGSLTGTRTKNLESCAATLLTLFKSLSVIYCSAPRTYLCYAMVRLLSDTATYRIFNELFL